MLLVEMGGCQIFKIDIDINRTLVVRPVLRQKKHSKTRRFRVTAVISVRAYRNSISLETDVARSARISNNFQQ